MMMVMVLMILMMVMIVIAMMMMVMMMIRCAEALWAEDAHCPDALPVQPFLVSSGALLFFPSE